MKFGLEIDYGGRGGGQESQFHSLFFIQAVIIAYNICTAERHSNESEKKEKPFESSITFVGQCLFVHEAIYQTEINIYFNNQHILINKSHNINTGVQSSNT